MSTARPLGILHMGHVPEPLRTTHGDFDAMFRAALGDYAEATRTWRTFENAFPNRPTDVCGVIVTGSLAMVTDREPWSETTAQWLKEAVQAGVPVLGVCYGHQLLGHGLGGRTDYNAKGPEIGTVTVRLAPEAAQDPLLSSVFEPELPVQAEHSQSVITLPPGARALAGNAHDPHHIVRFGDRVWGLQFHPEFTAPFLRDVLRSRRFELERKGLDPQALEAAVRDTPCGPKLLQAFAKLALSGSGA